MEGVLSDVNPVDTARASSWVTVSTTGAHAEQELAAVAEEIERLEPGAVTRSSVELLT